MTSSRSKIVERPSNVTTIGILTIVSGALNLLGGCGLTVSIVVGTIGLGLLCAPLTILPCVLGVFEIIYGAKLLANPPQPIQPSQAIAILEIATVLFANVVSLVVGILALVFYNDQTVKDYFEAINS